MKKGSGWRRFEPCPFCLNKIIDTASSKSCMSCRKLHNNKKTWLHKICEHCQTKFTRKNVCGQRLIQKYCSNLCRTNATRVCSREELKEYTLSRKALCYMTGFTECEIPSASIKLHVAYARAVKRLKFTPEWIK